MIVTNCVARIIVKIAAKIVAGTDAVTIWPCIFVWPKSFTNDKALMAHEAVHLEQWRHYWLIGFLFVYAYQFLKYGYAKMPLENEARSVQNNFKS